MTAAPHTPTKVVFPPGVLEDMEMNMSPDDLQSFMNEVARMAASGELETSAVDLDMETLETEDPELYFLIRDAEKNLALTPSPTLQ